MSVYLPHRRTLLEPGRVKQLSHLRPWRAVVSILRCWAIVAASWAVVAVATHPLVVLAVIPLIGTQIYGLFIIGHDAMHRRLHPRGSTNDLLADLLIFGPLGAITRLNKRNHLLHHRHLATSDDPDRHKHSCFRKATPERFLLFLTGLSSLAAVVTNVFIRRGAPSGAGSRDSYTVRDIAIIGLWQLALVGGLTLTIGWWAYPVLWLIPTYLHMYLGDLLRSFIEHAHPEPDVMADSHRLISFTSNRIERAFFAPMNMNFHAAHHLWPSIPFYNLPTADREMRRAPGAEAIEWRSSYVQHLLRWWRSLPLKGCDQLEQPA